MYILHVREQEQVHVSENRDRPPGENATARTAPFILMFVTHAFVFAATTMRLPSLPKKATQRP